MAGRVAPIAQSPHPIKCQESLNESSCRAVVTRQILKPAKIVGKRRRPGGSSRACSDAANRPASSLCSCSIVLVPVVQFFNFCFSNLLACSSRKLVLPRNSVVWVSRGSEEPGCRPVESTRRLWGRAPPGHGYRKYAAKESNQKQSGCGKRLIRKIKKSASTVNGSPRLLSAPARQSISFDHLLQSAASRSLDPILMKRTTPRRSIKKVVGMLPTM